MLPTGLGGEVWGVVVYRRGVEHWAQSCNSGGVVSESWVVLKYMPSKLHFFPVSLRFKLEPYVW